MLLVGELAQLVWHLVGAGSFAFALGITGGPFVLGMLALAFGGGGTLGVLGITLSLATSMWRCFPVSRLPLQITGFHESCHLLMHLCCSSSLAVFLISLEM